jgi:ribonucleoside-diphosphate reductase beta chain
METVHIAAYSHLLDTLGIPESEYTAFLHYKEMKDKYDYMQEFGVATKADIAKTLAVFGAFTEGLQLFASFAILLNFPRFNKMKGMGQIISWSVRDESLHTQSIIRLYRTFMAENPEVQTEAFERGIYRVCETIVTHEDAFIDLASAISPTAACCSSTCSRSTAWSATRCRGWTPCSTASSTPTSSRTAPPNTPAPRHEERGKRRSIRLYCRKADANRVARHGRTSRDRNGTATS